MTIAGAGSKNCITRPWGFPRNSGPHFWRTRLGHSGLLREVKSLLAQHYSKDSVFDQPAWTDLRPGGKPASRTKTLLGPGAVLGPYRIIGLLGSGGMGQV